MRGKIIMQACLGFIGSGVVWLQCSYYSYVLIYMFMTNSKGITNYGAGAGGVVAATFFIGFALATSYLLTLFLGFLVCCDENRKPRKQWFLLFPILTLVLIPGILLRDKAQGKLQWFEEFDYFGDMLVLACGGHYHESTACVSYPLSRCAGTKGELIVEWNTTNTTTETPLTCTSRVGQPSCEEDICDYDSEVKKDHRCPYANDEKAINQSIAETTHCMLDRYQSTTFPNCTDSMYRSNVHIGLYGNSKTCEATILHEHGESKFFKNAYKSGVIMITSSSVLLGLVFVGSFVEHFYLKGLAAQADDSAEAHEASPTMEMATSFDWAAENGQQAIVEAPVKTANDDEVEALHIIV